MLNYLFISLCMCIILLRNLGARLKKPEEAIAMFSATAHSRVMRTILTPVHEFFFSNFIHNSPQTVNTYMSFSG